MYDRLRASRNYDEEEETRDGTMVRFKHAVGTWPDDQIVLYCLDFLQQESLIQVDRTLELEVSTHLDRNIVFGEAN